ncbi:MAG: hypothetical protein BroJett011_29450 [Chloroflexota bacterium]|nr:MAG: hypothetical protein BroJett011_29450 [Chloroflexota bacterium]
MKTMKSIKLILGSLVEFALIVGLLSLVGTAPALAKAETFTVSEKFPLDLVVFVPCANGGAGEYIELSGNLHTLLHITLDGQGGYHAKSHFNPQGVSGTGLTTGDKYQGTGVTQDQFNGKVGFENTVVNNFRMIGQGPGNNLLIHENSHITVNANTITAFHDNFSVECK